MLPSRAKESKITRQMITDILSYSPETGAFVWLKRPDTTRANRIFNSGYAGKEAGVRSPRGYRYIRIRRFGFFAEGRLAWFYMKGKWPEYEIDHANGDPSDNRFENLRDASRSENGANRGIHGNNRSGHKGVVQRGNRWEARIRFEGRIYVLGQFDTAKEAYAAYIGGSKVLHGKFGRL